jgi:glycosyltransferase involved in cell wall biosynthesis
MVTVWLPNRDAGWAMPAAEPHDIGWIEGGRRAMHELAVAIAAGGRRVEFRGEVNVPVLDELSAAAGGVRVELPGEPRLPAVGDVVMVNEGVADPRVYARLALSPARAVLMVLAPLGEFGWPFVEEPWAKPDYETLDPTSLARPEHFAGAAALGFELWTHTPALASIASGAGVECALVGRGLPEALPPPAPARDIDVLLLERSHWPETTRRLAGELEASVTLPPSPRPEVLDALGRARVFVHPARFEALSRIGAEARAMGAVPVVPSTNPFAAAMDEEHGAVLVPSVGEIPRAVRALLADPVRLERLSARAMQTARAEVAWEPYVERVGELLSREPPPDPGRAARAGLGAALRADGGPGPEHVLAATRAELARHRAWLEATNSSLSWRLTKPLRSAKRRFGRWTS